jgi:transcriptional regulator with XRE-family HTH domain
MSMTRTEAGAAIQAARKELELSQGELAKKAEVPAWAVAQAERGDSVGPDRLNAIFKAAGLEPVEVTGPTATATKKAKATASSPSAPTKKRAKRKASAPPTLASAVQSIIGTLNSLPRNLRGEALDIARMVISG